MVERLRYFRTVISVTYKSEESCLHVFYGVLIVVIVSYTNDTIDVVITITRSQRVTDLHMMTFMS